jgi:hypothetical protein
MSVKDRNCGRVHWARAGKTDGTSVPEAASTGDRSTCQVRLKGRPHSTTSKAQPRSGPLGKRKNIIVDVEKVLELARIYFETGSYEAAQRQCLKKGTDMSWSGVTPERPA